MYTSIISCYLLSIIVNICSCSSKLLSTETPKDEFRLTTTPTYDQIGLKATLDSMDVEMPRTENSINNRVALMKQLHIEKIMKMNKGDRNPLRSMIEVITKFILEQPDFCSIVLEKSH
ncbi:hypothetical protein Ahia01_000013900, partial [Argonauta hians]